MTDISTHSESTTQVSALENLTATLSAFATQVENPTATFSALNTQVEILTATLSAFATQVEILIANIGALNTQIKDPVPYQGAKNVEVDNVKILKDFKVKYEEVYKLINPFNTHECKYNYDKKQKSATDKEKKTLLEFKERIIQLWSEPNPKKRHFKELPISKSNKDLYNKTFLTTIGYEMRIDFYVDLKKLINGFNDN